MSCFTNTICQYFKKHYLCNYNINSLFHIKMKLCIRHIITLIIASLISFTANADMSHPASSNFSDVFATTDRYQYSGKEFDRMNGLDLYDFHARQYAPVLGRFTTPDPIDKVVYLLKQSESPFINHSIKSVLNAILEYNNK